MANVIETRAWTEVQNPSDIFLPQNVSLTIAYSRHAKASDVGNREAFRHLVRSANIFIPETIGWSDKELHDVSRISMGDAAVYQRYVSWQAENEYGDFNSMELSALYASHVKVQFVDVSHNHQLINEFIALREEHGKDGKGFAILSTFEQTLAQLAKAKKHEALLQKIREDYILTQLGQRLRLIIDPNPKLSAKPKVDVVYVVGNEHTRIFDILQKTITPSKTGLPNVRSLHLPSSIESQEAIILNHYKGQTLSENDERRVLAELFVKGVLLGMIVSAGRDLYDFSGPLTFGVQELSDEQLRFVYEAVDIRTKNVSRTPEMLAIVRQLNLDGIFR